MTTFEWLMDAEKGHVALENFKKNKISFIQLQRKDT